MRRRFVSILVAVSIASSLPLTSARADLVTQLLGNGPPSDRVDIAIVGDGYTVIDLVKYTSDVSRLVTGLFSQEPFREYKRYFNVTKVDVLSLQSGADHPERVPPRTVDTAFDSTYNCGGIQRLICANNAKVDAKLSETLAPDERDFVIVLVNDAEYGGSGGGLTVTSAHTDLVELVLHEFAHSLGLLADEYGGSSSSSCGLTEPAFTNVTAVSQLSSSKWSHWEGVASTYEGAHYCDVRVYRPTYDSKMRSLGRPFEAVNTEQLIRRAYSYVSPISSISPASTTLVFVAGGLIPLSVQPMVPATHALDVEWFIDDTSVGSGTAYTLDPERLTFGAHEVSVVVSDRTPWVRKDTQGLLSESASWTIDVPVHERTYRLTDDAMVSSSRPTTNYGRTTQLRAGTGRSVTRSYMKFTVTGLTGTPADAKLRVRVNEGSIKGGEIRAVADTTWTERRLTHRRAPAVGAVPMAVIGSVTTGDVVEFDVTDAISGDGTYSFALVSDSRDAVTYSSKEGVLAPTLVINE